MFFTPDEILVYEGDRLDFIYLVISGSMEVSRDGQIAAIFGKGDLFGANPEQALKKDAKICRSAANVRALSYCDLQLINSTTFHELCTLFPEFTSRFITELSRKRISNVFNLSLPRCRKGFVKYNLQPTIFKI